MIAIKVLLKVIEVTLQNGNKSLDTYALLDDGSERTILLHSAAQTLQLRGKSESLKLRTVRQDVQTLNGATVSFTLIPFFFFFFFSGPVSNTDNT